MTVKDLIHLRSVERCTMRTMCGVKLVHRLPSAGNLEVVRTDDDCEGFNAIWKGVRSGECVELNL